MGLDVERVSAESRVVHRSESRVSVDIEVEVVASAEAGAEANADSVDHIATRHRPPTRQSR